MNRRMLWEDIILGVLILAVCYGLSALNWSAQQAEPVPCVKRTNKDRINCYPLVGTTRWTCSYTCRTYNDGTMECGEYAHP